MTSAAHSITISGSGNDTNLILNSQHGNISETPNLTSALMSLSVSDRTMLDELIAQSHASRCMGLYTHSIDIGFHTNASFANPLAFAVQDSLLHPDNNPVNLLTECVATDCKFEFIFPGLESKNNNVNIFPGSNPKSNPWKTALYASSTIADGSVNLPQPNNHTAGAPMNNYLAGATGHMQYLATQYMSSMAALGFQVENTSHSVGSPLFRNFTPVYDESNNLLAGSSIVLYTKLDVDHIQTFPDHNQLTPSGKFALLNDPSRVEISGNVVDANGTPVKVYNTTFDQLTNLQKEVLSTPLDPSALEQWGTNTFSGNAVLNKYIEQNYFFTGAAYGTFIGTGDVTSGSVTLPMTMFNDMSNVTNASFAVNGSTFNELKNNHPSVLFKLFNDISNNLTNSFNDPNTLKRCVEYGLRNDLIKFVPVDTGVQVPFNTPGEPTTIWDNYAFYGSPTNMKNVHGCGTYELTVTLINENNSLVWKMTKWNLIITTTKIEHNGKFYGIFAWPGSQKAGEQMWVNNVYGYPDVSGSWLAPAIHAAKDFWSSGQYPYN